MSKSNQSVTLPDNDDALVDEHFLSDYLGASVSKLRNDRYLNRGFDYTKVGQLVRYRVGDIRKSISESTVRTSH